jgi:AhpD family alkylhydroperoxidase
MTARLNWFQASPNALQAFLRLANFVHESGIEPKLLELVNLRASQINGCAYCIDMHTKDARVLGETEQRLYLLSAWREAEHLYTERERAALEWTEAVTLISEDGVPDEAYEQARKHFKDAELVNLALAVATINTVNRLNVAFRVEAGDYKPGQFRNLKSA